MPTEAVVFPAGDDECLDAWCGVAGMLARRQVSRSPARWTQAAPAAGPRVIRTLRLCPGHHGRVARRHARKVADYGSPQID